MKNLFHSISLFLILFLSTTVNAQFIHLNVNEESKDDVLLVFEDGSTKTGFVKNNKAKNKALRALALGSNANAFSNPEITVDHFLFKESKDDTNYQEIDIMKVAQVVFKNPEYGYLVFDRTTMYDINAKTLEVDYDTPKRMLFQANDFGGFKRYRIFVQTSMNGGSGFSTPYYYIKHPSKNEVIYVNPWSMVIHDRVVNYFKFAGSNCKEFLSYLDKVADKSSKEYAAFKQDKKQDKKANKAQAKLIRAQYKKNKKLKQASNAEQLPIVKKTNAKNSGGAAPYEYYFDYFYQKYLDCGCEPRVL